MILFLLLLIRFSPCVAPHMRAALDTSGRVLLKKNQEIEHIHNQKNFNSFLQGFSIAKKLETTEQELMHTIFPHPTLSEGIHESVLDAYNQAIHY